MKIKRWALLTALLYSMTVFTLTGPLLLACFYDRESPSAQKGIWEFYSELLSCWEYWVGIALLGVLQMLLLIAPLETARQRPVSRARWIWLAITAGLMMGLLIAGLTFVAVEMILANHYGESVLWIAGALGIVAWLVWALVFMAYYRAEDKNAALVRIIDRMIAGSVAELLIAVPCHVYARKQDYCCAGFGTFAGIATGLSVLLFAFGPGVFLVFVKRVRRLQRVDGELPSFLPDLRAKVSELNTHTKDAGIWALAGITILIVPACAQIAQGAVPAEMILMSRLSFVVMGAVSLGHGLRGYLAMEHRNRWLLLAAGALAEAVSLVAWWSFV